MDQIKKLFFLSLFPLSTSLWSNPQLESLATQGDAKAQILLAHTFLNSSSKDSYFYLYWMKRAALQGNPEACQYTARAYRDGIGTRLNISKAEDWYLKAYALGKVDSLTSLAEAFIKEEKFIDAIAAYKLAFQNSESIENKLDLKRLMDQHPEITIKSINSKIENLKKRIRETKSQNKKTVSSKKNRKHVRIKLPDASNYMGQFSNGKPNGQGKIQKPNRKIYIGEFLEGKENGFGTLFSQNGEIIYQGLWNQGNPIQTK